MPIDPSPPLRLLLIVLTAEVLPGAFNGVSLGRCLFKASRTLAAFSAFRFIPLLVVEELGDVTFKGATVVRTLVDDVWLVLGAEPLISEIAVVADLSLLAPLLIATAADHFKSVTSLGTGAGRKFAIVGTPAEDDIDELVRSL